MQTWIKAIVFGLLLVAGNLALLALAVLIIVKVLQLTGVL